MTNLNVQAITEAQTNPQRKPTASTKRAGAPVDVIALVQEQADDKRMDMDERMAWALKRHNQIEGYNFRSIPDQVAIGRVILDKRTMYKADQAFNKAIMDTPLGKIPYGKRKIYQDVCQYWDVQAYTVEQAEAQEDGEAYGIEALRNAEITGFTGGSADGLVRAYKNLLKDIAWFEDDANVAKFFGTTQSGDPETGNADADPDTDDVDADEDAPEQETALTKEILFANIRAAIEAGVATKEETIMFLKQLKI